MGTMRTVKYLALLCALLTLVSVGGVFAVWTYCTPIGTQEQPVEMTLGKFQYADIYITGIEGHGGAMKKTDHTTVSSTVTGAAVYTVEFYNESDIPYYYNEAKTLSGTASYSIEGIERKEAVEPGTYKTVTVRFSGGGSADIHFSFVVDKDSIAEVVARTAVDRFREILNTSNEYATLTEGMDDRAGWNPSSEVTYIGNVAGSGTGDSAIINGLFGDKFMSMDLDGDGETEPITMMIKRENLDANTSTGDSYSYAYWGTTHTEYGVEMTLYITAQNLGSAGQGNKIVVYAAAFTKRYGETEWVELVPLTKGTASANNYNNGSWGSANSFNTDTWKSDSGYAIEQLIIN